MFKLERTLKGKEVKALSTLKRWFKNIKALKLTGATVTITLLPPFIVVKLDFKK